MPELPKIIAVDFDGTCVDHRFPDVGPDLPGAVAVLKALEAAGVKLILWTMRSDDRTPEQLEQRGSPERQYLSEAVMWFTRHGIKLWGIQENPEQRTWTGSPKAYAHLYIDDAALGCPLIQLAWMRRPGVNWEAVAAKLGIDIGGPGKPRTITEPELIDGKDHRQLDPATGQQLAYMVLSPEERAKGFVRPVRRTYVHLTCGAATTMSQSIAETYARDPKFYTGTFCIGCRKHLPVGPDGDFVWDGTNEKVGT